MEELAVASELESPLPLAAGTGSLKSVILHLEVTDPEVVLELEEQPEDPERNRYALTALRLGVLSLRAAIRLKVWPASQILQAYGRVLIW